MVTHWALAMPRKCKIPGEALTSEYQTITLLLSFDVYSYNWHFFSWVWDENTVDCAMAIFITSSSNVFSTRHCSISISFQH
jgi:hypothetical protein